MTDERYKKLMEDVGMPNSRSLLTALRQVAHEVAVEVEEQRPSLEQYIANMLDDLRAKPTAHLTSRESLMLYIWDAESESVNVNITAKVGSRLHQTLDQRYKDNKQISLEDCFICNRSPIADGDQTFTLLVVEVKVK